MQRLMIGDDIADMGSLMTTGQVGEIINHQNLDGQNYHNEWQGQRILSLLFSGTSITCKLVLSLCHLSYISF